MTKWNLPEGRKPLTDEDMAALTRRLADTAIERNELYQAAKRDAEEAEAYAASLESDMNAMTEMLQKSREGAYRIEELEAKLAKAVDALDEAVYLLRPDEEDMLRKAGVYRIVTTLAELKGQNDD